MDHIRVLIADDHPVYRDGIRASLHAAEDIEIIGEASTGDEAIALAGSLQPDVILMDIKMPGTNGIEATRRALHVSPHIAVLMLTMFEDGDSVFAAMRAGARGYLMKDADQNEILRAIRAVSSGDAIFSPTIAQRMIRFFSSSKGEEASDIFPDLTEREREILEYIAKGYNNIRIAETLVLSPKTVRNHVSNIFSKLQVTDRAQAIIRAREAGLR